MAWITPKTNWTTADGVDFNDLNRVEGNISFIATNPSGLALQLSPSGGNVLIGTTSDATKKIHISAAYGSQFRISRDSALDQYLDINAGGNVADYVCGNSSASFSNLQHRFYTQGSDGTSFAIMSLKGGNRVLIGTTTDNGSDRLQVSGGLSIAGNITPTNASTLSSWALTTTPMLIPRGIYSIRHVVSAGTNSSTVDMWNGSVWTAISTGNSNVGNADFGTVIFSDGVNFQIGMTTGTGTATYRKF